MSGPFPDDLRADQATEAKVRQWFVDATKGRRRATSPLLEWHVELIASSIRVFKEEQASVEGLAALRRAVSSSVARRRRVCNLARDFRAALSELLTAEELAGFELPHRTELTALQADLDAAVSYTDPLGKRRVVWHLLDDWHTTVGLLCWKIRLALRGIGVSAMANNCDAPLVKILQSATLEIHGEAIPSETMRTFVNRHAKRGDPIPKAYFKRSKQGDEWHKLERVSARSTQNFLAER